MSKLCLAPDHDKSENTRQQLFSGRHYAALLRTSAVFKAFNVFAETSRVIVYV